MDREQARIGKLLKQITEALKRRANSDMRPQGVTMSQMHVLLQLYASDSKCLSFRELEKNLDVAQSTMWGLVNRLETKGLVACVNDPNDVRAKLVRMTDAGTQVCVTCHKNIDQNERQMIANLSQEEVDVLVDLLERVYASIG